MLGIEVKGNATKNASHIVPLDLGPTFDDNTTSVDSGLQGYNCGDCRGDWYAFGIGNYKKFNGDSIGPPSGPWSCEPLSDGVDVVGWHCFNDQFLLIT
jgi:hypothetical protein